MLSRFVYLATLYLISGSLLYAQTPAQQRTPNYYNPFCQASPFTVSPPDPTKAPPVNPLMSWALSGCAKVGEQLIVLLQNKQNPAIRITVISNEPNPHNIEVISIEPGNTYKETKALIRLAGTPTEAWLTFEPALLQITKPNNPVGAPPATPQPPPKK